MINFTLSPELLAGISGAALSLLFNYFPAVNTWYAALKTDIKSLIMIGLMLVVSTLIYLGSCQGWFVTDIVCGKAGVLQLVSTFLVGLVANQGVYKVSPQIKSVTCAIEHRDVVEKYTEINEALC